MILGRGRKSDFLFTLDGIRTTPKTGVRRKTLLYEPVLYEGDAIDGYVEVFMHGWVWEKRDQLGGECKGQGREGEDGPISSLVEKRGMKGKIWVLGERDLIWGIYYAMSCYAVYIVVKVW